MTRVAELTQDTKQRVEAFYRIGKALDEKLGDRVVGARALRDGARSRSVAPPDHRRAPANRDRRGRLRQGRALPRSGAELHDRRRASARASSWSSASCATRCSATTRAPCSRGKPPTRPTQRTKRPRCRSSTSTSRSRSGRRPSRLLDLLVRKSGKRERSEQHALQNKLGQVCAALNKDDKALKAYTAAHPARPHRSGHDPGPRRGVLPAEGLGGVPHELPEGAHRAGEGETAARADVYYKLGCIKREQGQAEAGDQQLREGARPSTPRTAPTLEALVALYTRAQGLEAGRRVQAADPRQRRSTAKSASAAERDRATSGTISDKNPRKAIEALEEARELAARRTPACSTSSSRSTRRPRTGRR